MPWAFFSLFLPLWTGWLFSAFQPKNTFRSGLVSAHCLFSIVLLDVCCISHPTGCLNYVPINTKDQLKCLRPTSCGLWCAHTDATNSLPSYSLQVSGVSHPKWIDKTGIRNARPFCSCSNGSFDSQDGSWLRNRIVWHAHGIRVNDTRTKDSDYRKLGLRVGNRPSAQMWQQW